MCMYVFLLKEINYKFYKAKIWGGGGSLKNLAEKQCGVCYSIPQFSGYPNIINMQMISV